jgi:hypothetical protein
MEAEIRRIVERMWKDVASLPWQDASWVNSPERQEQTRQHFVKATTDDLIKIAEEKDNNGTNS